MLPERMIMRRVLLPDVPALEQLYAAWGKEAGWATAQALADAVQCGTGWCGTVNGRLTAAWLCVPPCADNACAIALRDSGAAYGAPCCILPPVCPPERYSSFLAGLAAQAVAGTVLMLPVKTDSQKTQYLLQYGFVLTAMRPLYALRPHYIMRKKCVQTSDISRIIVPWDDTLHVSRALWAGYVCTAVENGQANLALPQEK